MRIQLLTVVSLLALAACAPTSAEEDEEGTTDGTDGTTADGADGGTTTDGTDGSDGSDGTDGSDGSDGSDGTDGTVPGDELAGNTYVLSLADANWVKPAGAGDLISGSLEQNLLLNVEASDDSTIDWIATLTESLSSDEQDRCIITQDIAASYSAPNFSSTGGTFSIGFGGLSVTLYDFAASGRIGETGITGGTITAQIDARELATVITDFGGPDDICDLLGLLGSSCGACADGQSYCVDTELQDLKGDLVDVEVVRVTEECR